MAKGGSAAAAAAELQRQRQERHYRRQEQREGTYVTAATAAAAADHDAAASRAATASAATRSGAAAIGAAAVHHTPAPFLPGMRDRVGGSLLILVPTVARRGVDYLTRTVDSLLAGSPIHTRAHTHTLKPSLTTNVYRVLYYQTVTNERASVSKPPLTTNG